MPHYTITPLPEQHLFRVCLRFSHHGSQPVRLSLPNWVPGSYMIREFARHIVRIEASCSGQATDLQAVSKNIWNAEENTPGDWLIEYDVYAFDLSVRGCYLDGERAFFDGAALFFQVASHSEEPHQVELRFPGQWQTATTLPKVDKHLYRADNYRHLIDCPLEAGTLETLEFTAEGIPHRIVLSGHYPEFDRQRLLADTQAICTAQLQFFPNPAPFAHYTFLLHLGDHVYGGLEHTSSTALLADRSWLPENNLAEASDNYTQLLGLISHEYFHAWNVKSIKPAALAHAGLRLHWLPLPPSHNGGCGPLPAVPPANDFGARFQQNGSDITLSHVLNGGSAEQAGLAPDDRIVAINGYAANNFATQWQQQKTGSQTELHYFRHGVLHHTSTNTAWITIENPAALQAWLQI